jgi:hypothetical protein
MGRTSETHIRWPPEQYKPGAAAARAVRKKGGKIRFSPYQRNRAERQY